jgi:hypothetical protein
MIYRVRGTVILTAIAAALVPLPSTWIERVYSRTVYLSVQPYITSTSNLSPVALLDLITVLAVALFLAALRRDWRMRGSRAAIRRGGMRLVTGIALVYLLFVVTWGMNYRRVPLESKLDFDPARISQAAAMQLASTAVHQLNAGYSAAHANQLHVELLERSFVDAQRRLGSQRVATVGRPKRSLLGIYFRYAAIDGMTVPVVLEVILNPDVLAVERPSVLAHEWAHLAGYADESEANFVAWISGVRSEDPVARYSAWLDAYTLARGALPRDARASLPPLAEGPQQDLRDIASRYARSSPFVRHAARGVYDSYLKANRIDEGIANYGVVLQLILGTQFEAGWAPLLAEHEPRARTMIGGGVEIARRASGGMS